MRQVHHVKHKFFYGHNETGNGPVLISIACIPRSGIVEGTNVWSNVTCKHCLKRRKK